MAVQLHHDAITGTAKQFVTNDYQVRLSQALTDSKSLYNKELSKILEEETGIRTNQSLVTCLGSQNSTVIDCPISNPVNKNATEFVVVVHNTASKSNKQYSKVLLPSGDYVAKLWSKNNKKFEDVPQDIFEQAHFATNFEQTKDYELNVYTEFKPSEVGFLKIEKITNSTQKSTALIQQNETKDTSLEIQGFNALGEVIFRYKNQAQNIS